jgi:5-methyltetrahydrofolate--homocysteine methyltransferase
MNRLLQKLAQKKILVSDGAWGTMLQSMGLQAGDCPEKWNISHPDEVKSIAKKYIAAGAEFVLTNTFGGSPFKLANYGYEDKAFEFNRAGAQLSKQVAGDEIIVAASVGPTGKFLEPLGEVSEPQMQENFQFQIKGLVDGGADAILIETMSDLSEAKAAVKAAKAICDLPVIVTMTFEKGNQGYRTMMGVSIQQAVTELTDAEVDLLGTNCGNGIEQVVEIISEMRRFTNKCLVAHPNAGIPKLVDDKTIFDQTPEEMSKHVPALIEAGANIIGGCCGTNPAHIAAIAEIVHSVRNRL